MTKILVKERYPKLNEVYLLDIIWKMYMIKLLQIQIYDLQSQNLRKISIWMYYKLGIFRRFVRFW